MDIDVGQALETDFVHLRDELGEQELEYLQRTRGFVRDEVLSYRDHIDVGIVADRDQIDDTWPLIEGITRALDDLEAAVRGKEEQA